MWSSEVGGIHSSWNHESSTVQLAQTPPLPLPVISLCLTVMFVPTADLPSTPWPSMVTESRVNEALGNCSSSVVIDPSSLEFRRVTLAPPISRLLLTIFPSMVTLSSRIVVGPSYSTSWTSWGTPVLPGPGKQ